MRDKATVGWWGMWGKYAEKTSKEVVWRRTGEKQKRPKSTNQAGGYISHLCHKERTDNERDRKGEGTARKKAEEKSKQGYLQRTVPILGRVSWK